MIKIALVDDHVVLRKSLAILIGMFKDFTITMQADNGRDFIDQLKPAFLPDIVMLDITMPVMDGMETALWLKQHYPHIKVIALSMIKNDLIVIRMLKNGARGYLLKDCEPSELRDALNQVYHKGYYYNGLITPQIRNKEIYGAFPKVMLTEPELIFIRWACTEKNYKEIAEEMNVSPRTIDGYRDAVFRKLNISSRVGIAIYAIMNGFVKL